MLTLQAFAREALDVLDARHQRRRLREIYAADNVHVTRGNKQYISFSGNDYFGLSRHPEVVAAAAEALRRDGAGAGASRLVTGNHPRYAELETLLAAMKGTEAALVFGSGYL
ncbi:MAG: aminotransferase class I/II-fold pyridoxal phosphate-dependent enzyme, partial [Alphaproteobacteria bacterium]|nr:aminotransferase class I/II-fold pyridoxal phosphate-dependent enzyme [Alphaproteobacteria bacterium]